jgi:hypothetical protein
VARRVDAPFWEQVEQGQVVDARMRLKHQHEAHETEAA